MRSRSRATIANDQVQDQHQQLRKVCDVDQAEGQVHRQDRDAEQNEHQPHDAGVLVLLARWPREPQRRADQSARRGSGQRPRHVP